MTQLNKIRRIAVFCGSNTGKGDAYMQSAQALGTALAMRGIEIIYGGTNKGLMGQLADAATREGGKVSGVITRRLHDLGHAREGLHSLEVCETLRQRKDRMKELADAVVALPGGIGTLEEFMEVWSGNQLGEHAKPSGLLNVGGYFDRFSDFLDNMISEGFLPESHKGWIVINAAPDTLIEGLENWRPVTESKWMK